MKNILGVLAMCAKYQDWHTYKRDKATKQAVMSLIKRGYLEENKFGQIKYTGKTGDLNSVKWST